MISDQFNPEETNQAVVRRLYDECLNQGKFEVADQIIAPDFISPGPEGGTGPAGFKKIAGSLRTGFPDIQFTIHEVVAENDRVALRWTWEGTHRGTFMNIAPTGKQVQQEAIVMFRLAEGKITELKAQVDRLGFLQQLGVLPALPVITRTPAKRPEPEPAKA
jgi:steroid delta-isomerase-like uncharacterized protein